MFPLLRRMLPAAVLAVAVTLTLAVPATAQVTLAEAEEAYTAQLAWYQEVLRQRAAVLETHERLVEQLEAALRERDQEVASNLQGRVHDQGLQLLRWETVAERESELLRNAAQNLLGALSRRQDELSEQIERSILPITTARLRAELQAVDQRYGQVSRESGAQLVPQLIPVPEIRIDLRDSPADMRDKADFMESRAVLYDTIVVSIEREIASRERRLRATRGADGLLSDLSRFDDDLLTGGGLPRLGAGAGGRAETETPLVLADLTLPEQIAALRLLREQAEEFRNLARERAEAFRTRADGPGTRSGMPGLRSGAES